MEPQERNTEDQDRLLDLTFDPTPHDDIHAAMQAMGVIEDLDLVLLTEDEATMVRSIKKMCLHITHQALFDIYQGGCYGS